MKTLGSVAAVVAAIREEANAELERLERETGAEIAGLAASGMAPPSGSENDPRVAAARARARDEESQSDWTESLEDLRDRERWMDAVVAAGRRILADISNHGAVRTWTRALVVEAAACLPAGACVVVVPAAVAAELDAAWRSETTALVRRQLAVEPGALSAGCIVRLADRPMAYDNSLEARERRTQVDWRAALARVYADAVSRRQEGVDTLLRGATIGDEARA